MAHLLNCQSISQSDYIVIVLQQLQGNRQLQVTLGNGMSCSCEQPAKSIYDHVHM